MVNNAILLVTINTPLGIEWADPINYTQEQNEVLSVDYEVYLGKSATGHSQYLVRLPGFIYKNPKSLLSTKINDFLLKEKLKQFIDD